MNKAMMMIINIISTIANNISKINVATIKTCVNRLLLLILFLLVCCFYSS